VRQGLPLRRDTRGVVVGVQPVTAVYRVVGYVRDQTRPRPHGGRRLCPRMCVLTGKALFRPPFQWREFNPAELVPHAGGVPTHPCGLDPADRAPDLHAEHLLADVRRRRHLGVGAPRSAPSPSWDPWWTVARGGGCRVDGHLRRPGRAPPSARRSTRWSVLGIDPIHRLVVPRGCRLDVCGGAAQRCAVITIGLVGGFIFGVYLQNVSAGAYVSTLTLITGAAEVVISIVKAGTFGLIAGLVGCYRGLTVGPAVPRAVGTAVNETLVLCVIALFAVNVVLTTIGVRFGTGS